MRRRLLLFFPISLGMRRRLLFFSGLRYKENLFRCKHGFLQLNFLFESFNEYSMILLLVLVSAGVVREGLGAVAALMHLASIRLVLVLELVQLLPQDLHAQHQQIQALEEVSCCTH